MPARSAARCRPGRLLWLRFPAPVKWRRRAARLARRQVETHLRRIRCPERLPALTLVEILAAVFRQEKMPRIKAPALSRTAYSDRSRQGEIEETALETPRRLCTRELRNAAVRAKQDRRTESRLPDRKGVDPDGRPRSRARCPAPSRPAGSGTLPDGASTSRGRAATRQCAPPGP